MSSELTIAEEKKCSYCGRQVDSGATNCSGCGTPLNSEPTAKAALARTLSPEVGGPWLARDAWKCLGMLLVFEIVLDLALVAAGQLFPAFRHFRRTGYGHFFTATLFAGIWVLTVLYFARVERVSRFLKDFGLSVFSSDYYWFVVVVALGFRFASDTIKKFGHLKGATTTSLLGFARTTGPESLFYLAPALMAPFYEEICLRGFVYTALRRSYSMPLSMAVLLGITLLTHYNQMLHSGVAFVSIGSFTLFLCYLRERTGNLWNCILCHFVFNLSGALLTAMRAS